VALLEATSVSIAVMMQTINIMTNGGKTCNPDSCPPNHSVNPDTRQASERANPLPNLLIKHIKYKYKYKFYTSFILRVYNNALK
jgi:hypothetical protein